MEKPAPWHFAFPKRAPLVLIVLLNWNNAEETATAVAFAREMDYPNFRIVIVDNGSQTESLPALRALVDDRVELIESPVNKGYTGGCNLGIQHSLNLGAQYIWLLNNDAVVRKDTLSSLVALAERDETIGLVTPHIAALGEDRLTFAGGVISVKDGLYNETQNESVAEEWSARYPKSGLVIGTAMLVRAELVRKIGGLDERFFAYFEDIDYSTRSAQAGFLNLVDPNSLVRHAEKNRNNRPFEIRPHYWYYMARNESRFWRKHRGLRGSLRLSWDSFNGFLRHHNRLATRPESRKAILAGLWDGWLDRGGEYRPGTHMPAIPAAFVKAYSTRRVLQPRAGAGSQSLQTMDS